MLLLAAAYVALHLSGSSYALALGLLGEHETPLVGHPRLIRTDEWSVATPLFQAAVNNHFHETNDTSFYHETLRSFIGLPLLNWGLVFKPLVWPFFLVPPALAYSFLWAASAALMLIGWSLLLRTLGFSRTVAALTSAILYFSPFVQAWSGPGAQLAFFPWVMLALVRTRSPMLLAVELSVLVPVWLISLFYLPAIPPLVFLALALCLAFKREVFVLSRLVGALAGAAIGVSITMAYFSPVLRAFADSVYPGSRWVSGGGLPEWQVLSQFLPGTTTEHYANLVAANICEAATVATWLPVLALCIADVKLIRSRYSVDAGLRVDLGRLGVLASMWSLLTLWQLLPVVPLSYLLGLGLSPEARTLFASGTLLVIAAAYAIDRLPIRVTPVRLGAFATVVVGAWLLASIDLQPTRELRVRDELLVLPLVVGTMAAAIVIRRPSPHLTRVSVFLIALLPVVVGWGLFNPLQSTRVMFRKPDTEITRRLDALSATRADGAIAVPKIPDAVLNGVGYRSVTHVIATPSPHLFRKYFPRMDEAAFEAIFNRYAHVELTARARPFVVQDDLIAVPMRRMAHFAALATPSVVATIQRRAPP